MAGETPAILFVPPSHGSRKAEGTDKCPEVGSGRGERQPGIFPGAGGVMSRSLQILLESIFSSSHRIERRYCRGAIPRRRYATPRDRPTRSPSRRAQAKEQTIRREPLRHAAPHALSIRRSSPRFILPAQRGGGALPERNGGGVDAVA